MKGHAAAVALPPRAQALLVALALLLAAARTAAGCELPPGEERIAGDDGLALSYRSDPPGLSVDRHFALVVHICSDVPVTSMSVDAHMPEHRHGMNYKPTVAPAGPEAWRADGLLFHMPGKWELVFAVGSAGKVRRVTHTITVP